MPLAVRPASAASRSATRRCWPRRCCWRGSASGWRWRRRARTERSVPRRLVEKDVGPQEHREDERALRRMRDMPVAARPPHIIAGARLALVVDDAAFEHVGLLDLDMLVQRQVGPGLPAEECGKQP